MPDPPSPRRREKIGREELRRRREEKLAALVASAARALDGKQADEFEKAQELVDEATLLSPEDPRVVALWKRLDAGRPARVKALLDEARTLRDARSLEAAAACAERAVDLQPDSRAALELRNAVRARLSAGNRRAQAGWRIAAGIVIGVGSLVAATLALLPDAGPVAESAGLVPSGEPADGDELDASFDDGPDPVSAALGLGADASDGSDDGSEMGSLLGEALDDPDAAFFETGRIDGTSLTNIAGAAFPEERPAAPDAPAAAPPRELARPPAPTRTGAAPSPAAPSPAAPSPTAPIVVARLCDENVACGALRVRVQPAAEILFNGVQVGNGAQGMLRLPAGRHQIRLRSDEHEFRRMVTIARGAPAALEVDLEDEGLPLLAQ